MLLCPFCGGAGIEDNSPTSGRPEYAIVCQSCGAQGGWAKSPRLAVRLWDMRYQSAQQINEAELLPPVEKDVDVDAWQLGVEIQE